MNRQIRSAVILILMVLGITPVLYGQVSAGAVLGTVSDTSGALIPGVTITVTNEGTNQARQAITNETGTYRVEPLQQGTYTVTAELTGFRKEVRPRVTVDVNARIRLDFALQVGQVSETVEVQAAAACNRASLRRW